jgi:hypothetical protein
MYHIFAKTPIVKQMFAEGGLFGAAKKVAKSAKKSDDKEEVIVPGLGERLEEWNTLKDTLADAEGKLKMVDGELRELSREKFVELYRENKANPGSFYLRGDKGGCMLVQPSDKYISIKSEEDADRLKEKYGDDIVETEERYYFNNAVLEKNQAAIEKAIMGSSDISDADKKNLLVKEVKNTIKKGTINELSKFGAKLPEVFLAVQPIFALKQCGTKAADGMDVEVQKPMTGIFSLLSAHEITKLREIVEGDAGFFDNSFNEGIYDKLYDHYSSNGDMPYGVQKARTEDPEHWIAEHAAKELR